MSSERIVVGLDVGTTKVCTLVGEVGSGGKTRIIGLGIEPAQGMSKGTVVDVSVATEAVRASKRQAERTSGYEIGRAFVTISGKHVSSTNRQGFVGLNSNRGVTQEDIDRALDAACAINLPHNREVVRVIPRSYTIDEQTRVPNPLGLYAYRLDVDAHIITAGSSSLRNLEKCVNNAGLGVDRFVPSVLASAEIALSEAERKSGVVVIDIGGGTTDIAVYIEGTVWHTAVLEIGGYHITNDIAQMLHLPTSEAERIKIDDGNALPDEVSEHDLVTVYPFGEEMPSQVLRHFLAQIIEARVEEIFSLALDELKRSGYETRLPAGVVLTGGTAALRNIRHCAAKVLDLPVRVASLEGISGLVDKLNSPAYATGVGLLRLAHHIDVLDVPGGSTSRGSKREGPSVGKMVSDFLSRLLPD